MKGGEGIGEGEWFRYILREGTRKMEEAKARTFRAGGVEDGKTRFFWSCVAVTNMWYHRQMSFFLEHHQGRGLTNQPAANK